ncbi:UreD urease accessory protein-domain-containing protein [Aspergillus ambiguus]|uniref:urease accessory protein UreD n=1 Tax=Aspergillus ambiguus TaxID=176160 RepID=UPI003CCDDA6E
MTNPMPREAQPGTGELEIRTFCGSSSISTISSTYPLKLVATPCRPTDKAVLVFMMTYGGGLVAGDSVNLNIRVRSKARLALLTQGSTKLYKTPSKSICSRQNLNVTMEDEAALLLLPDPVQPFKDSAYNQYQLFDVHHPSSSLLVLDWISKGRAARGEAWGFSEWKGRNDIWSLPVGNSGTKKRLLLRDSLVLDKSLSLGQHFQDEMDNLGIFGTLIIRGPIFRSLGDFFIAEFSHLPRIQVSQQREEDNLQSEDCVRAWTASFVRGSVIVKFGAREVDTARRWLRNMLMREGTVEKEFGERSLLCLQ